MDKCSPRIVIIGAGVAGLAAATSLLDKGFDNVKIIEAENRLGGRIYTVPFGSKFVDIGAHWVHGETDNSVYSLANKMDLLYHSNDFSNVYFVTDDKRKLPNDIGMTLFGHSGHLLQDEIELQKCKGSVQDYLIPKCRELGKQYIQENDILEALLKWISMFECTVEGCDQLSDVSASGLAYYKQCEGDPTLAWKSGGYYNIIDMLLRTHPNCSGEPISLADRVVLNTEALEIDWNGLTAFIKCSNNEMYKADHVIITVSLGVLKEKYQSLFNPPLPVRKVRSIMGLGMGTVNKIYLRFPERWWPEDCSGFSLLRTKRKAENERYTWERDIIGFYTESSSDPTVLSSWIVGEGARDMEIYSDEEVLMACHRLLLYFLAHEYNIPKPEDIKRSKWFYNSHFRGSYSFRSINTEALNTSAEILSEPLLNDYNKEMLLFAGEATHKHYYSTVHGALESGWREAKRIAEIYCAPFSKELVR